MSSQVIGDVVNPPTATQPVQEMGLNLQGQDEWLVNHPVGYGPAPSEVCSHAPVTSFDAPPNTASDDLDSDDNFTFDLDSSYSMSHLFCHVFCHSLANLNSSPRLVDWSCCEHRRDLGFHGS